MKTDEEYHQEYLDNVKKGEAFRVRALELAKQLHDLVEEFEKSGAERFELRTEEEFELLDGTPFYDLCWIPSDRSC